MATSHRRLDLLWAQGAMALRMNIGLTGNSALQQALPLNSNWLLGGAEKYGLHSASGWPFGGGNSAYANNANPLMIPKGWRNGDWICNCGFHNYSSRAQCKKCNASLPSNALSPVVNATVTDLFPTHGTKRLTSEEFVSDWDNKRLNAGDVNNHFLVGLFRKTFFLRSYSYGVQLYTLTTISWKYKTNGQQQSYQGSEQVGRSSNDQTSGGYASFLSGSSSMAPNIHF